MSAILLALPKRRGRYSNLKGRQECLRIFPANTRGRKRIYAIAFSGGIVKIGQTNHPRTRLRNHWNRGSGEVEWVHLFGSVSGETATAVERAAPSALQEILQPVNGSEWYRGCTERSRIVPVVRECIEKCRAAVQSRWDADERNRAAKAAALKVLKDAGIHDISFYDLLRAPTEKAAA